MSINPDSGFTSGSASASNLVIRDGLETDIATCLALDHTYETDTVWQMQIGREEYRDQWSINLRAERLPRTLETVYPADEARLRLALPSAHCFLVAVSRAAEPDRGNAPLFGYLTMTHDPAYQVGFVRDLVVSRPYREGQIGTRLLNVARRWAKERSVTRLMIQTQSKNYPAISFCQHSGFTFCGFNDRYFLNQDIAVFFSQSMR